MKELSLAEARNVLGNDAVLLHIGAQKTGTTALQTWLASLGTLLDQAGWTYVTSSAMPNANRAMREVLTVPYIDKKETSHFWSRLVQAVEALNDRKVCISSEFLATASDQEIKMVVDSLGKRRIHILLTVRSISLGLPSQWQENMQRWQEKRTLEEYAAAAVQNDNWADVDPFVFWSLHNYAAIINRWERYVGPGNITVIVVDPNDRNFVYEAVGSLLNIASTMGKITTAKPSMQNRSLSAPEAALTYAVHSKLEQLSKDYNGSIIIDWPAYKESIKPGAEERRLVTPHSARDGILRATDHIVQGISESGANVLGSLRSLFDEAQPQSDQNSQETLMKIEVAAAIGAFIRLRTSDRHANKVAALDKMDRSGNMNFRNRAKSFLKEQSSRFKPKEM